MVRRERQVDRRGENESDSIHCCRVRYTVHCTLYTVHCTVVCCVRCTMMCGVLHTHTCIHV